MLVVGAVQVRVVDEKTSSAVIDIEIITRINNVNAVRKKTNDDADSILFPIVLVFSVAILPDCMIMFALFLTLSKTDTCFLTLCIVPPSASFTDLFGRQKKRLLHHPKE